MTTDSELRLHMSEVRKWLTGEYESLPAGVILRIKSSDFDHDVLKGLSKVDLIIRARALLGDAQRVVDQLALGHPHETRLINNLTFHASALSDALRGLDKSG
jgi:hypothetical protein